MPKYRVGVLATLLQYGELTIEADSEAKAEEAAADMSNSGLVKWGDLEPEDFSVESVEEVAPDA